MNAVADLVAVLFGSGGLLSTIIGVFRERRGSSDAQKRRPNDRTLTVQGSGRKIQINASRIDSASADEILSLLKEIAGGEGPLKSEHPTDEKN